MIDEYSSFEYSEIGHSLLSPKCEDKTGDQEPKDNVKFIESDTKIDLVSVR